MFGLEAMGTTSSESRSLHPPAVSQAELRDYPEAPSHDHLATVGGPSEGHDAGMLDFMLTDDELAMWSNMSPTFGWVT